MPTRIGTAEGLLPPDRRDRRVRDDYRATHREAAGASRAFAALASPGSHEDAERKGPMRGRSGHMKQPHRISHLNGHVPRPDLVLITGDLVDTYICRETSLPELVQRQLEARHERVEKVTDLRQREGLQARPERLLRLRKLLVWTWEGW